MPKKQIGTDIQDSDMRKLMITSFAIMFAIVSVVIISRGQLTERTKALLSSGDIPVGTLCSEPSFGDGSTPTHVIVERLIGQTVGTASNEDQVVRVAVMQFGQVLAPLNYIQLCADADETGIATMNGVNLGR